MEEPNFCFEAADPMKLEAIESPVPRVINIIVLPIAATHAVVVRVATAPPVVIHPAISEVNPRPVAEKGS